MNLKLPGKLRKNPGKTLNPMTPLQASNMKILPDKYKAFRVKKQ